MVMHSNFMNFFASPSDHNVCSTWQAHRGDGFDVLVYHAVGQAMPRIHVNPGVFFAGTMNTLVFSMMTKARAKSKGKRLNFKLVHKDSVFPLYRFFGWHPARDI